MDKALDTIQIRFLRNVMIYSVGKVLSRFLDIFKNLSLRAPLTLFSCRPL